MPHTPRVLLLNGTCLDVVDSHRQWLSQQPVDLVADQNYRHITSAEMNALLRNADGIIVPAHYPIDSNMIRSANRLRVISLAASGYDWLDVAAATDHGIVITNATVEEGAEAVADMAWGLMLAVARQIPQHDRQIRAGNLHRGMGIRPWRKNLGIIGLGNIGRAVARRAPGFDMRLLATAPRPDLDFVERHHIELVSLEDLLARSDFVSLHVRLNDSTRGMIGYQELKQMKPSAFLINTARRKLVAENDLNRALEDKCLAGAGLDDPPSDPCSPFVRREDVVCTTHVSNRAHVAVDAVFRCAVQNAVDVLTGRTCRFIVNPEVFNRRSQPSPDRP